MCYLYDVLNYLPVLLSTKILVWQRGFFVTIYNGLKAERRPNTRSQRIKYVYGVVRIKEKKSGTQRKKALNEI